MNQVFGVPHDGKQEDKANASKPRHMKMYNGSKVLDGHEVDRKNYKASENIQLVAE